MALLEKIWEGTNTFVNGVMSGVGRGLTGVFGTSNARAVKRYTETAQRVSALEPKIMAMSDAELKEETAKLKNRLAAGETLDDILVQAFALCREGGRRFLKMRHYDVQLIGGMVLHYGNIAEMVTGEGKTLVATLPAYLNALEGRGVHVVTVNDYLARRDMEWMAPLYMGLGLTVGNIQSGMPTGQRQLSYAADITYATNNELGFDYLRDNMRMAARGDDRFRSELQQSQGPLYYAIIDEVDNILIDEARTPLIISGPAHQDAGKYLDADKIARQLKSTDDFVVNEKDHTVNLTDDGIRKAEKLAGVESFYTSGNMEWPHLIDNSLKAHHLYKRDVNYVVKEGTIVIVDEFTGRLMEGRQWSDGLHQAVEAKEGVKIKEENQTLATITLQNYFKLYKKLSGMTGTAMTEANEFYKTYKLDVIAIPTNRGMQRIEHPDSIYLTEKEKYKAVADDIEVMNKFDQIVLKDGTSKFGEFKRETDLAVEFRVREETQTTQFDKANISKIFHKGRPILVGTVSIEKSERLSKLLEHRGIKHQVLNAKFHERESEIVAQAGRINGVTIATNMAGRGTDIILGGNPETKAWSMLQGKYPTRLEVPKDEWNALVQQIEVEDDMKAENARAKELGGLMVIGTERHESRRIDLQLRGRCGRQGDPGESRFYLSLEDDLMRIFAGDWVRTWMGKLGMGEGEALQSNMLSKRISAAQKKVEERHFEARKSLLEYDEVMDFQRKKIYGYRQQILDGVSCRKLVLEQIRQQIDKAVETYLSPMFGAESFASFASNKLSCQLDAREFRGVDIDTASTYARDLAQRAAETQIVDAIDENLPSEEEQSEWNYEALAKWSNTRYETNYNANALRKIDRNSVDEELVKKAHECINRIDLSEGADYLQEDYGARMLSTWMKNKFGLDHKIDIQSELADVKKQLSSAAESAYREREVRYPLEAALNTFAVRNENSSSISLSPDIAAWIANRFEKPELATTLLQSDKLDFEPVMEASRAHIAAGEEQLRHGLQLISQLYGENETTRGAALTSGKSGRLEQLATWMTEQLNWKGSVDKLTRLNKPQLENRVQQAVDDHFFPEIRGSERDILLRILDETWMSHLLAMDHLRSAVSFRGMGQMDPKVEYKREGMKLFEQMWFSVGERVTDVIFRAAATTVTPVPTQRVRPMQERHDDAESTGDMAREASSQAAAPSSNGSTGSAYGAAADGGEAAKTQPIRRNNQRVGRNDPCPCGSGKKYKNCCLRNE
jgi:preprotein translocase subunit SecA